MRCSCVSHLGGGYWLRQERRARAFADEMERLDREDPDEARRRDAALLKRPTLQAAARRTSGGWSSDESPKNWSRCRVCGLGHERRWLADACCAVDPLPTMTSTDEVA